MSDFFMLKTDKVQKFIELRDDTLIKWSISPIYYKDICENCLLYEVDESVGEIAYQEVLETCPLCVNGSKLNYNEDYAPMSEDALKEYLAIGDPDSLTFIESTNTDTILSNLDFYFPFEYSEHNFELKTLGQFSSIVECREYSTKL